MHVRSRVAAVLLGGVAACAAGAALQNTRRAEPEHAPTRLTSALPPVENALPPLLQGITPVVSSCAVRPLKLPSGQPAAVSCQRARRVVAQVRARLPVAAGEPAEPAFADAVSGWLDPHGLWSAAPDAPAARRIRQLAAALIADVERAPADPTPCAAAAEVGSIVERWVDELRSAFEAARRRAGPSTHRRAVDLAREGIFEDDPVTRPALVLSRSLAERVAAFEQHFASSGADDAPALAAERFLPALSSGRWSEVVLAAVLRAYVPGVDAHGQWAPLDEEWSLYAGDSALDAGPRLWGRMVRTALGVRLTSQAEPPLENGDLLLAIGGIVTVGLSVEQLEQLGRLEPVGDETEREVVVLRRGSLRRLAVPVALPDAPLSAAPPLRVERVAYGSASAVVVPIDDVADSLGEDLSELIGSLAESEKIAGILLDLRGNGGGSTDGAAAAIGVFLPGAPSFPLFRRGGSIEVQRAILPSPTGQWRGPVAVLVDGYTASAAEMIAGAIQSYGRGLLIGARTFGKGCIQEYFDDRSGDGVLRLTTMLFSLPDGTALQGVGLTPSLRLALPDPVEREASLPATPPPWQGPDIRAANASVSVPWPNHGGRIGSCRDPDVCTALRRLGAAVPATHATHTRRTASLARTLRDSPRKSSNPARRNSEASARRW